jgi:spermidine/putrescine transport system substrate-binding protein
MARHPKERPGPREGITRRELLKRSAVASLALPSAAAILDACSKPGSSSSASGTHANGPGVGSYWPAGSPYPLARQNSPVEWKLWREPIKSGLAPEKGATLHIYNWADYVWIKVVKQFCEAYNCDYQITTFNNMDEALAKMRTGQLQFDAFMGVTPDVLGKLITGKLLQPINHSYLPHLASDVWETYQNPFYDQHAHYTVPYVVYTTGIGYRRDLISDAQIRGMSNPYEVFWDTKFKGKVGIYDDYREAISMALLKNGITDLNTANPKYLDEAQSTLISLINTVNVRTSINGVYIGIPKGTFDIHQAWSGDSVASWQYTPTQNMQTWQTLGYWFPADRKGAVFNDTITIPANAQHPVLAHHFLDWMMTFKNAMLNYTWNGYQPPQRKADPETLTTTKSAYGEPYVFPWMSDAVVRESDFHIGYFEEELTPQVDQLWHNVWQAFNSG